ncbi:hypothetical protein SLEP1_g48399 [Rubroshorea leprosula]|uniref:Uncharacterized protein n=1 Tax=Rubroshorea leprosula TaxID=152421 RepID=A0AAV5LWI0_9ROSI|nr:hypothetical protein SLEP1_g48399 [Rubroshorea leprosula]
MVPKELARLKSLDSEEVACCLSNLMSTQPLIQRVTPILSDNQDIRKYFQPISVAIGPLHHPSENGSDSTSRVRRAEKFKLQLAAMFIKYSCSNKEDLYNNVKNHLSSLKRCYDPDQQEEWKKKNWDDEDLAWMLLVDGCAILYFIYLDVNNKWEKLGANEEEQQPQKSWQQQQSQQRSQWQQQPEERSQRQQQQQPQQSLLQQQQQSQQRLQQQQQQPQQISIFISDEEDPAHLLALLHRELIGVKSKSKKQQQVNKSDGFWGTLERACSKSQNRQYTFRGATELKGNGIFFKARHDNRTRGVTDIEFCDNSCMPTIELHPIVVDDSTIPKLLNLIAYEMCPDFRNDYGITTYVAFLDSLIDKGEDVKELRVAGVLHNGLGSDEAVARLFNQISDYLVPNPDLYSHLQRRIQVHCNSVWASDLAQLYHTYFRTPWSFLVFLGAIAGLLLTGLQTYKDFNKPAP